MVLFQLKQVKRAKERGRRRAQETWNGLYEFVSLLAKDSDSRYIQTIYAIYNIKI